MQASDWIALGALGVAVVSFLNSVRIGRRQSKLASAELEAHERNTKQWKFDVLKRCMAYRFDVTGDAFTKALNEAIFVYADDAEVVRALREFRAAPSNDRIETLLRAMANASGVGHDHLERSDFLIAFNPRSIPPAPPAS